MTKKKCRKCRKSRRKTQKRIPTIRKPPPEIWINETIIIIWEEDFTPPPPYAQAPELARTLAGTRLAGPTGRKWAECSLSPLQDGKAKGKKGATLLPSGERLLSACNDNQRGVPCNTPLHDYRGNI